MKGRKGLPEKQSRSCLKGRSYREDPRDKLIPSKAAIKIYIEIESLVGTS